MIREHAEFIVPPALRRPPPRPPPPNPPRSAQVSEPERLTASASPWVLGPALGGEGGGGLGVVQVGWGACLGRAWGPRGSTPPHPQPRSRPIGIQGCSPGRESGGAGDRGWGRGTGRRKTKGCEALNSKRCFESLVLGFERRREDSGRAIPIRNAI